MAMKNANWRTSGIGEIANASTPAAVARAAIPVAGRITAAALATRSAAVPSSSATRLAAWIA